MKKKIIFITPHLSTGGLPQYLCKKIELLKDKLEVFCIEYSNITGNVLVVQRDRISSMLDKKHFISLGDNKNELLSLIKTINPDYIHMEEIPEYFCDSKIAEQIYTSNRSYKIFETSHDNSFNPDDKLFFPDKFLFVSKYQKNLFSKLNIPSEVVEYPIDNKIADKQQCQIDLGFDPEWKHVINVGLFTPRKNQAEVFKYAELFKDQKIKFHFIGNQADNFKFYWEPLMQNVPLNCIIWSERSDTDKFYQAADLLLFTSKGNTGDIETSPIVIREGISWNCPTLIYNLPTYLSMYDQYSNIEYLTNNIEDNKNLILKKLNLTSSKNLPPIVLPTSSLPLGEVDHRLNETTILNGDVKTGIQEIIDVRINPIDIKLKNDIFIISTYPNTEIKEQLLNDTVKKLKSLGQTVLIASHYPVPDYIIKKADYYLYDGNNMLDTNHTLDRDHPDFWMVVDQFRLEGITLNHLSSLSRIFRLSMDFIKTLNYDYFTIIESDSEYDIEDLKQFDTIREQLDNDNKQLFFFQPKLTEFMWHNSNVYESYCFGGYVDNFTTVFNFPKTLEEWNTLYEENKNYDCLEYILYRKFKPYSEKYYIIDGTIRNKFLHSKIDLCSVGDPSGVYYNTKEPNKPIFLLYNNTNDVLKYRFISSPMIGENEIVLNPNTWYYIILEVNQYNNNIKLNIFKNDNLISTTEETISKESLNTKKLYKRITFN